MHGHVRQAKEHGEWLRCSEYLRKHEKWFDIICPDDPPLSFQIIFIFVASVAIKVVLTCFKATPSKQ